MDAPRVFADAIKIVPNTAEDALYVHADHLARPQKMTDEDGSVVWDAAFRPFGEVDGISGTETSNLRFPGQYADIESALAYNWHRHYDPTLGRYIQSDPIGLKGGLNTYAYVEGNPVMRVDPDGLVGSTVSPFVGPLADALDENKQFCPIADKGSRLRDFCKKIKEVGKKYKIIIIAVCELLTGELGPKPPGKFDKVDPPNKQEGPMKPGPKLPSKKGNE